MTEPTNGFDEATLMHFIREENSLRAQIAALKGKRKNFRSGIKSFGIALGNFDSVFEQFNAQDGGQQALEDLREQRRLARLAGLPFGHQFSLIDDPIEPVEAPKGGAYQGGRAAFIMLLKESENPFHATTEQGQDWLNGYRDAETLCREGKERASEGPQAPEGAADGTLPARRRKKAAAAPAETAA